MKHELVDDLSSGGSQNTKFWYIDYNMAVHVIRLRIHLLQTKLQSSELRARSSSMYLCPGYKSERCNGKYTETDAQRMVDTNSGRFLCRECVRAYTNHPNAPPVEEYTLQLVDNQVELKSAMDNLRRVNVQFSSKMESISSGSGDGSTNQQQQQQQRPLRQGIFDLLQKVRPIRGAEPITSNLPSENIAMGVGSNRLAGTGRTAKNLITKLVKQGIVSADGRDAGGGPVGGRRSNYYDTDELTFLKNAMGQEIAFELERGGGARANLLCTKGKIRNKLVDAAARKGHDLGLVARVILEERERLKRKRQEKEDDKGENGGGGKKKKSGVQELEFLQDNIGLNGGQLTKEEKEKRRLAYLGGDDDSSDDEDFEKMMATNILPDETDELRNLPENDRMIAFQQQYKMEVERQIKLFGLKSLDDLMPSLEDDEDGGVAWEDG